MKKAKVLIICLSIIVLVLLVLIITINFDSGYVGTYKTDNWNGTSAVLVLKKDHTYIRPSGSRGIWKYEGGYIVLYGTDEESRNTNGEKLEIVPKGIMISEHFFEKIK